MRNVMPRSMALTLNNTSRFLQHSVRGNEMKADISAQTEDAQHAFAGSHQSAAHVATPARADHRTQRPGRSTALPGASQTVVRPRWLRVIVRKKLDAVLALVSLSLVLLCWYLLTRFQVNFYVRFANIPSPGDVLQKFIEVNRTVDYANNVLISLRRILFGFGAAAVLGISLGLLIGRYRYVRALCFPAIGALRPIPALAWVPISVMLWPTNEVSIVFITFLGAFFPVLLKTVEGVHAFAGLLLRSARA